MYQAMRLVEDQKLGSSCHYKSNNNIHNLHLFPSYWAKHHTGITLFKYLQ